MKMLQTSAAAYQLGYHQGLDGTPRNSRCVPADFMTQFQEGYRLGAALARHRK